MVRVGGLETAPDSANEYATESPLASVADTAPTTAPARFAGGGTCAGGGWAGVNASDEESPGVMSP